MSPAAKLAIAIVLDVLDAVIGRVPGYELFFDAFLGVVAVLMFGKAGLFAFWELADPTGQIDGFAPTLTLIALNQMRKGGADKSARPDRED